MSKTSKCTMTQHTHTHICIYRYIMEYTYIYIFIHTIIMVCINIYIWYVFTKSTTWIHQINNLNSGHLGWFPFTIVYGDVTVRLLWFTYIVYILECIQYMSGKIVFVHEADSGDIKFPIILECMIKSWQTLDKYCVYVVFPLHPHSGYQWIVYVNI